MFIPKHFFYNVDTASKDDVIGTSCFENDTPDGGISPDQRQQLRPKILILTDWTLVNKPHNEKKQAIAAITSLINSPHLFSVYVWQNGKMVLLTQDNGSILSEHHILENISPLSSNALVQMISDEKIPREAILPLNAHELQQLQESQRLNQEVALPFEIKVSDLATTNHDLGLILNSIGDEKVVFNQDIFCSVYNKWLSQNQKILEKKGGVTYSYEQFKSNSEANLRTLSLTNVLESYGYQFSNEDLKKVKIINLNCIGISTPALQELLSKATGLKKLIIMSGRILTDDLTLSEEALTACEEIDLSGSSFSMPTLQKILGNSKRLKKLTLVNCANIAGNLTLPEEALTAMEDLDLFGTHMDVESLESLLLQCKNIKKLNLELHQFRLLQKRKLDEKAPFLKKFFPKKNKYILDYLDRLGKSDSAFKILDEIGATRNDHSALYEFVEKSVDLCLSCLNKIKLLGLRVPDHQDIILQALKEGKLAFDMFTWLETNQISPESHDFIYKAFFLGETALLHSPYHFSRVIMKLEQYLKLHPLCSEQEEGYPAQRAEMQALLNEVRNESMTEGPLNKSAETRELEAILKQMAMKSTEKMDMRYEESLGYMLQFGDEPEIYLSELLRLVNFNHIALSEKLVKLLWGKITELSPDFERKETPLGAAHRIGQELPEAARWAINCYVDNRYYKNINRLFRGVALLDNVSNTGIWPVHSKKNLMVNFLAGALVNWAAAELPRIVLATPERAILEKILSTKKNAAEVMKRLQKDQVFYENTLQEDLLAQLITQDDYVRMLPCFDKLTVLFPIHGLLDRAENLEISRQEGELGITAGRLANPEWASSVVSFSVFPQGVPDFQKKGAETTKLETSCSTRPIVNPTEGEILVPKGTAFRFTENPAGGFFAREVNSPGIVPSGGYWSAVAIAKAYRNHLSKGYNKGSHQISLNNKTVHRPNHSLAHTYRVMEYIDVVLDYFAHHAEEDMFRLFCQYISPEEREWLRVAAAYSVTGRENEIAVVDDLQQYDEFREASMNHMAAFLDKYPAKISSALMKERMLHIVRWMGNPGYETARPGQPLINEHPDPDERAHRNFIHRILMIAHKLDLPRCYTPRQFTTAMKSCQALAKESLEQKADYLRMIRYAIDLIGAHGDSLYTVVTQAGELAPCSTSYRPRFGVVSTSLRQLRAMSNTVPRPKLLESYQFPECDPLKSSQKDFHEFAVTRNRLSIFESQFDEGHTQKSRQVQEILDGFKDKIAAIGEHKKNVKKTASKLYDTLQQLKDEAFYFPIDDERLSEFVDQAKQEIKQVSFLLQQDLGWGDYLVNLTKQLVNLLVKVVSFGTCQGFFVAKPSDTSAVCQQVLTDLDECSIRDKSQDTI